MRVLLAFVFVHSGMKVLFFSPVFLEYVADPTYEFTGGLVTHAATAGLLETAVLLTILIAMSRVRPADIGLRRSHLLSGIAVTIFVWSAVQTATVMIGNLDGGVLAFGLPWRLSGYVIGAGLFEAQAGGAFIEEIIYRGFLLPQVYLLLRALSPWSTTVTLGAALLISQAYFALNHLPAAILTYNATLTGASLYLTEILFVGILFSAVYIRTGNLFVAIGLHALINFPSSLFVSRFDPFLLVLIACCSILIMWPYLNRWMGDVFTMRPSTVSQSFRVQTG